MRGMLQHISERVQAMGFQEATTEIWSVDSQYSKDNGVMVLVTGSLQCKVRHQRCLLDTSKESSARILNQVYYAIKVA